MLANFLENGRNPDRTYAPDATIPAGSSSQKAADATLTEAIPRIDLIGFARMNRPGNNPVDDGTWQHHSMNYLKSHGLPGSETDESRMRCTIRDTIFRYPVSRRAHVRGNGRSSPPGFDFTHRREGD
jgi:hypothetical protein